MRKVSYRHSGLRDSRTRTLLFDLDMRLEYIKAIVLKMRPPAGVYGNRNIEEWRIEKAAELGYMTALYDVGIISIKSKH